MLARNLLGYFACLFLIAFAVSCQDDTQLRSGGELYLDLPAERYQYNNFADTNNAISTLGRVLFYDRNLSVNNTVACASCHKQAYGFADNQAFSRGFAGKPTTRNSMPVQNTRNLMMFENTFVPRPGDDTFGSGHLFWDGRESVLQRLVLQPIGNHIEMG